jgi:ClpP class serine protease
MMRRYDKQGILALDASAMYGLFPEQKQCTNEEIGTTTVVMVRGPYVHHRGWWCDSYDGLIERVELACESNARDIVLLVDSPGGELGGCFEAARAIREKCSAAGKRLVAFVEGQACSGGYALACAAEQIVIAPTAIVGSIGVLFMRADYSDADKAVGVRTTAITSGSRKADGQPQVPTTDAELAAHQKRIDALASVFFDLVSELRGVTSEAVDALEAGVMVGAEAVSAKLADRVQTWDGLLAALATGGPMADESDDSEKDMESAREALAKLAKGEGDEAQKARRALDALDGKSDDEEDDEEESDPPAAAAPATTAASAVATAADFAAIVQRQDKRIRALEKERAEAQLSALFASRPDLTKDLVSVLSTKPYAEAKAIVDAMPKPATPPGAKAPAATAVVQATRNADQKDGALSTAPGSDPRFSFMDQAMGFAAPEAPIRREGTKAIFGVPARRPPHALPANSEQQTEQKPAERTSP